MNKLNNVTIIDTPGMREIGMHMVSDGMDETFGDVEQLICQCKFSDCTHTNEPGCAINKALGDGSLSAERYNLYLSLKNENKNNYQLKKDIAQWKKQMKKLK